MKIGLPPPEALPKAGTSSDLELIDVLDSHSGSFIKGFEFCLLGLNSAGKLPSGYKRGYFIDNLSPICGVKSSSALYCYSFYYCYYYYCCCSSGT